MRNVTWKFPMTAAWGRRGAGGGRWCPLGAHNSHCCICKIQMRETCHFYTAGNIVASLLMSSTFSRMSFVQHLLVSTSELACSRHREAGFLGGCGLLPFECFEFAPWCNFPLFSCKLQRDSFNTLILPPPPPSDFPLQPLGNCSFKGAGQCSLERLLHPWNSCMFPSSQG